MSEMIKEKLLVIKEKIKNALNKVHREDDVTLIAVTKTHPAIVIKDLFDLGIKDIGENYVQEMLKKMELQIPVRWHFIGGLQRNKTKYIVGKVFLIHSLDNLPLAEEINRRASNIGIIQDVLIQINQGEETKGGVPISNVEEYIKNLNKFNNIRVLGLMAMPPYLEDDTKLRGYFSEIRELRDYLNKKACYREALKELSMGMSSDYEIAIEEGSTMIRIGTALLGERILRNKEEKDVERRG